MKMETASTRILVTVLLLPHGNADPKRGFSVKKQLLERHSNNIQEDTLESIRIVKDFLVQSGGLESIEVTAHTIDTCKGFYWTPGCDRKGLSFHLSVLPSFCPEVSLGSVR